MTARWRAAALGLAAALAFAALAGTHLTAQGPQYDELHQAVGAFTWTGAPPPAAFCLDFRGTCVLTTTYSAALKTNLYGLFLRLSGRGFQLADWRWLGIFLAASAFPLFAALARKALHPREIALFFAFLLTDGTLLLLGRFDGGPVAIAFLLRMALAALWLSGEASAEPTARNAFALGALAGFATFEKLSSCLLVPALAVLLAGDPRRRSLRHFGSALVGIAFGALPLALTNLGWLLKTGEAISLRTVRGGPPPAALDLARELLALGFGKRARELTLGPLSPSTAWLEQGEIVLLAALLLSVAACLAVAALRWARRREAGLDTEIRRAGLALLAFLTIGAGLWALPLATSIHHWILATPFQYLALVFALRAFPLRRVEGFRRAMALAFTALLTVWLGGRLLALGILESALRSESASAAWDPALSELGRFAADRPAGTLFVATDWGVATQIQCFSNGRPGLAVEPFWDRRGLAAPDIAASISKARTLYVVRPRRPSAAYSQAVRAESALAADPAWREVPLEPEAAAWRGLYLRKYRRASGVQAPAERSSDFDKIRPTFSFPVRALHPYPEAEGPMPRPAETLFARPALSRRNDRSPLPLLKRGPRELRHGEAGPPAP